MKYHKRRTFGTSNILFRTCHSDFHQNLTGVQTLHPHRYGVRLVGEDPAVWSCLGLPKEWKRCNSTREHHCYDLLPWLLLQWLLVLWSYCEEGLTREVRQQTVTVLRPKQRWTRRWSCTKMPASQSTARQVRCAELPLTLSGRLARMPNSRNRQMPPFLGESRSCA